MNRKRAKRIAKRLQFYFAGLDFGILDVSAKQLAKMLRNADKAKSPKVDLGREADGMPQRMRARPQGNVAPSDGGCWYCYSATGDMEFCCEFDCYVHLDCLRTRLKDWPNDLEALIIARELLPEYRCAPKSKAEQAAQPPQRMRSRPMEPREADGTTDNYAPDAQPIVAAAGVDDAQREQQLRGLADYIGEHFPGCVPVAAKFADGTPLTAPEVEADNAPLTGEAALDAVGRIIDRQPLHVRLFWRRLQNAEARGDNYAVRGKLQIETNGFGDQARDLQALAAYVAETWPNVELQALPMGSALHCVLEQPGE